MTEHDPVNHPAHYTSGPSCECGRVIECIQVAERMSFALGNAVKYLWRAGLKGDELQDLRKASWYVQREIERIEKTHAAVGAFIRSETAYGAAVDDGNLSFQQQLQEIQRTGTGKIYPEHLRPVAVVDNSAVQPEDVERFKAEVARQARFGTNPFRSRS